ncbi:MAG: FIMAH domain-containing protein [Candidatus Bipolaricaulia bacterium]
MARLAWLIPVACLLLPGLCRASGEWEGTAEFRAISDTAGLLEESLDLSTALVWDLSLAGLDLEVSPSFEELTSDVHAVNEAISAIEKLESRRVLQAREELKAKLAEAKVALERGEDTKAVAQLRHFIFQVEALRVAGELTTKEANSLIEGTSENPGAERIIGKIDKGRREQELKLNLSTTIAGVELAWGLQAGEAIFPAPGKDHRDTTISFAIEADYSQLDLSLGLGHQHVDFFQRWSWEDSKRVDQMDLQAELDLGSLGLTKGLSYEATFFPERIGEEVEVARVAEVSSAIERLKEGIASSLSIPSEVKPELINKLQGALDSLAQSQRGKAVDYLLGFLDLVERRRRDGRITEDEAEWLISEVWAILPRARSRIISGTMGAEFALSSLDLEIEVEGTGTLETYPAETKKDERAAAIAIGFEAERGEFALEGDAAWKGKLFPNDPAKDELLEDWEGTATFATEGFAATGSFGIETTICPNSSAKNNVARAQGLKLEWDLARADFTLRWEQETTNYPSAPGKDKLVDELGLSLEFAQPDFTIDLEREATIYPLAPAKDKLVESAEFKLDWELAPEMQFSLAINFAIESYPAEPAKAKTTASIELALEQKF